MIDLLYLMGFNYRLENRAKHEIVYIKSISNSRTLWSTVILPNWMFK